MQCTITSASIPGADVLTRKPGLAKVARLFPPELVRSLVRLRRDLHRHPELSFQEHRTAARLERALAAVRPASLERVAGTGLVARIRGRSHSVPAVAIRGDIDALPIQEQTGLPFSSRIPGVMHACGHDVHATWAVGAAALLSARPPAGDVVVLLQPAEETGKGAQAMIEAGVLDGVAAIFGGHVDRRFAVGQVVAQPGSLAAASDTFEIEIAGAGAHGARPHEGKDPIVAAAALIAALQTIVSRRLHPATPAVVTVGSVHAGSAPNVIPDSARLSGTLRALEGETREKLHHALRQIAGDIARAYGVEAKVAIELGPPPLINHETAVHWARQAVEEILGKSALVPLGSPNLAGEDFAWYLERIPGCFLRIGAREEGTEPIPAHSPQFYAAEEAIWVGAAVLAQAARVASASLAARGGGPEADPEQRQARRRRQK
ncbi:putative hydrolase YxeP [bacterium HR33]|nr:putative hydrolase YxeP [bacterium HR33]